MAIIIHLTNAWMFRFFEAILTDEVKHTDGTQDQETVAKLMELRLNKCCFSGWTITQLKMKALMSQLHDPTKFDPGAGAIQVVKNTAKYYGHPEMVHIFNSKLPEFLATTTEAERALVIEKAMKVLAVRYQTDMRSADGIAKFNNTRESSRGRDREPSRERDPRDRERSQERFQRDRSSDRRVSSVRHSGRDRSVERKQSVRDRSTERKYSGRSAERSVQSLSRRSVAPIANLPSREDAERQQERQDYREILQKYTQLRMDEPKNVMRLEHYWEVETEACDYEDHQAEVRSLMASNPGLIQAAEDRAAQGLECKFCGMDTAVNLLGSIPTQHTEATCRCVNPHLQQLEAWRVLKAHGSSSESIHMILESIKTKGAFKTKPNLFNDFAKAVEIEQERRERRKQEWILNNRNSANPGTTTANYQRYGPGAGR